MYNDIMIMVIVQLSMVYIVAMSTRHGCQAKVNFSQGIYLIVH